MSSKHPLGVHGMKQSLRSPLASFPALTLVNLKQSRQNWEEGRKPLFFKNKCGMSPEEKRSKQTSGQHLPIHILVGCDGVDDGFRVDGSLRIQRQLHYEPVHGGVLVQGDDIL